MIYLVLALFILLIIALVAHGRSQSMARRVGLPAGQLIYSDTGFPVGRIGPISKNRKGVKQERPLRSRRYGLVGRPDYLVRTDEGIVPVEAKSAKCPASGRPFDSHIMQLAVYCLLVEDVIGEYVPYGVVRYHDREVRIDFTAELREELMGLLEEMREAYVAEDVHRNHKEAQRCLKCSFSEICEEALL